MTSRGEKSLIVELTPGPRPGLPYFLISGVGGHVLPLQPVAKCILRHQGLGVIFPGFVDSESDYETVEDVAERMLRDIRAARPSGPYLFVGYSFGGIIGLEMASRLSVEGEKVGLVLLDS
ncbi:MAG: thioesterase domain-containing protein, partial [Alphaproteobacteria bacterium]|nr:thioesterase domain-containing protein [Alphaproteobacteria bacterium]